MNLKKRIKKLQEKGKRVDLHHYSFVQFDGYEADKAARNFWIGAMGFITLVFLLSWWGYAIYHGMQSQNNPDIMREQTRQQTQERIDKLTAKEAYVDSCKAAGTSPTDMGDNPAFWKCK